MSNHFPFFLRHFRYFTFPGVFVHELAHEVAARLCGVRVFHVQYFQWSGEYLGYVEHARVANPIVSYGISMAPLLFGTVLGTLISVPVSVSMMQLGSTTWGDYFLSYIGISILAQAFPSTVDADIAVEALKRLSLPYRILFFPLELSARFFSFFLVGIFELPFTFFFFYSAADIVGNFL